jgi:hypothetical protein
LEARERILEQMSRNIPGPQNSSATTGARKDRMIVGFRDAEPLLKTPPEAHHHISTSRNFPVAMAAWLASNQGHALSKVTIILTLNRLLTIFC